MLLKLNEYILKFVILDMNFNIRYNDFLCSKNIFNHQLFYLFNVKNIITNIIIQSLNCSLIKPSNFKYASFSIKLDFQYYLLIREKIEKINKSKLFIYQKVKKIIDIFYELNMFKQIKKIKTSIISKMYLNEDPGKNILILFDGNYLHVHVLYLFKPYIHLFSSDKKESFNVVLNNYAFKFQSVLFIDNVFFLDIIILPVINKMKHIWGNIYCEEEENEYHYYLLTDPNFCYLNNVINNMKEQKTLTKESYFIDMLIDKYNLYDKYVKFEKLITSEK